MTYTAILSLSILEDGLSRLDRPGIVTFLRSTQLPDGSFTPTPEWGESDVRLVYCAFVLCFLLDDWSHIDVEKAVDFVRRCRTYEGGFGQTPGQEAQGGTTYCSIAALNLVANIFGETMAPDEREETVRWLIQRQTGGFQGRTEKEQDACYSFWCGAALQILGAGDLVDADANAEFLNRCQFKFGGIAKIPEERPDIKSEEPASWVIGRLHTTINAQAKTAQWAIDSMRQKA
ncbi:hypothetical protein FRB97_004282 [Tulasnella sp. 331]|nr:hypothetical protein FRB97_004282 [Tulasnella sp. 331]